MVVKKKQAAHDMSMGKNMVFNIVELINLHLNPTLKYSPVYH